MECSFLCLSLRKRSWVSTLHSDLSLCGQLHVYCIFSKFHPTLNFFLNKSKLNPSETANMVVLLKRKQQYSDVAGRGQGVTVRLNFYSALVIEIAFVGCYLAGKQHMPLFPHTHTFTNTHSINMRVHGFTCCCTQISAYMPTFLQAVCLHLHKCACAYMCMW